MTTTMIAPAPVADGDNLLDSATSALRQLRDAAVDVLSDTRNLTVEATQLDSPPSVYDRVRMIAQTPQGPVPLRLLEGAHEQLSDKLRIDWRYYERMLKEDPELLAININNWHHDQPKRRLVRLLKPITTTDTEQMAGLGTPMAVRAVLADHYRPIDHGALLNQLLPTVAGVGARVTSYSLTEKRFYIKFATDDEALPQMIERLGIEHRFGRAVLDEVIGFGAAIRNSETGHGALLVDPGIQVKHCTNQLVIARADALRVIHLGGRLEEEEDTYQVDTKALDNAATFLKVRDRFASIFSDETRRDVVTVVAERMGEPIPLPADVPVFEFLGNVSKTFNLTEQEQSILKEEVVAERIAFPQELTPWTVSQGLTATAKHASSADRADELQRLGWKVLSDPVSALLKAGKIGKPSRN